MTDDPMRKEFLEYMKGLHYGEEETADAWAWFQDGWQAALRSRDAAQVAAEFLAHGEVMTRDGKLVPRHEWRADYVPPAAQGQSAEPVPTRCHCGKLATSFVSKGDEPVRGFCFDHGWRISVQQPAPQPVAQQPEPARCHCGKPAATFVTDGIGPTQALCFEHSVPIFLNGDGLNFPLYAVQPPPERSSEDAAPAQPASGDRARIASLEALLRVVADRLSIRSRISRNDSAMTLATFTPQEWAEVMKHRSPTVKPTSAISNT